MPPGRRYRFSLKVQAERRSSSSSAAAPPEPEAATAAAAEPELPTEPQPEREQSEPEPEPEPEQSAAAAPEPRAQFTEPEPRPSQQRQATDEGPAPSQMPEQSQEVRVESTPAIAHEPAAQDFFAQFACGGGASSSAAAPPAPPAKRARVEPRLEQAVSAGEWRRVGHSEARAALALIRQADTSAATVRAFHRYLVQLARGEGGAFAVLVAVLLSVQVRDTTAMQAMERLRKTLPGGECTADAVHAMPDEELESTLNTLNFYKTKAKNIALAAQRVLLNGLPRSLEGLLDLHGVGPKVGLLVLTVGFANESAGIVVDTHCARVSQRLGWADKGCSAEKTRKELEKWVDVEDFVLFPLDIVSHGQLVCISSNPKCHSCPARAVCPSSSSRR